MTLQRRVAATDAFGAATTTWETVATLWAEVLTAPVGESMQAGQVIATAGTVVTIRYRSGVTPQHRFVWRGRNLNIVSTIEPNGDREWLECRCLEDAG